MVLKPLNHHQAAFGHCSVLLMSCCFTSDGCLFCLWFGSSKPSMHTFLKPFVEQCRRLQSDGFMWYDCISKCVRATKVFAIVCSCDSVARALLQNIKQFNGKYGCSRCLHPGQSIATESVGPPKHATVTPTMISQAVCRRLTPCPRAR